jgi:antitoxin HicB
VSEGIKIIPIGKFAHPDTLARVVQAEDAIKLAVIEAFNEANMLKRELARRHGKTEKEARRILDPDHHSKLGQLQDAMQALGNTIVVSVLKAA